MSATGGLFLCYNEINLARYEEIMKITVYLGSSFGNDPIYKDMEENFDINLYL